MATEKALKAFVVAKTRIDRALAQLIELSDEHFAVAPDDVNWAHVGDLGVIQTRLEELVKTFVFHSEE